MKYRLDQIYKEYYNNRIEMIVLTFMFIVSAAVGILIYKDKGQLGLYTFAINFCIVVVIIGILLFILDKLNFKFIKKMKEKRSIKDKDNFDNLVTKLKQFLIKEDI